MAVIDVVSSLIGIGTFLAGLVPKQSDEDQTVVRIGVGMSKVSADNTGGNQPGIHLYDVEGRSIGSTFGSKTKILDGGFMDISVPFDSDVGQEPTDYIAVTNGGDDALCIAYIVLTQPDGDSKVWYGDIAKACGADWYPSELKTNKDDYQAACIWIDRDHSNGLQFQGFGLHINDFASPTQERVDQYNENMDLMCKAEPRLKMYEKMTSQDPISFFKPPLEYNATTRVDSDPSLVLDPTHWVLTTDLSTNKKRVVDTDQAPPPRVVRRQKSSLFGNKLVVSESIHHSAKELCESAGSVGPDFVSLAEQLFCDMDTRKTWPLCGTNKTVHCFDRTSQTIKVGNGTGSATLDGIEEMIVKTGSAWIKAYEKTIHWT